MGRRGRGIALGLVAAAMLGAAGPAAAQTTTTKPVTTTTTTATTTTTLLPHPFSAATAACVHQARAAQRACHRSGATTCFTAFETTFANCFAPGTGVKCAMKCVASEGTCFSKLPTTKATCRAACATSLKNDVKACRLIAQGDNIWAGGDGSCIATAQGNFTLCRAVCAALGVDCQTTLKFCIANCPNM